MPLDFENDAAFEGFAERVKWRQDKAPHAEGSFSAVVLHGETQSESAGPSRGGMPADGWSVIVGQKPAVAVAITCGDTLELQSGVVLTVQQISRDPGMGWVISATANASVPK